MADELKRVGVTFTAEGVQDFKKSLKDINASMSENAAAYKLAQSQWDKNTTSSQKLADKQKYLASQTTEYQKKVDILTAQLKEMESAENRDETAIKKKKAELEKTQATLNSYKSSLDDVNRSLDSGAAKLGDWAESVSQTGDKVKALGDGLTDKVTKPLAGVAAASIAAWTQVDEGLDIVFQKTGATGEALEEMQDSVKKIAQSIPVDYATAGTAIGEVNTRFAATGEELETLSTQFIKFAQINDTDVTNSVDSVSKIMQAYQLQLEDIPLVLDTMNAAGQRTGISMDSLQSSLIKNQASLQSMGMEVNNSINFLADLEMTGIDSATVMTGLQKAFVNASKEGKTSGQAMAELQKKMADAEDETSAMQAAIDLFGAKAAPALVKACKDGILNFDDLTNHISDDGGSVSDTFDGMTDATDNMQMVLNSLMEVGYELAEAMMPMIQKAVEVLVPIIQKLTEKWKSLSPGMQDFIIKAGLAAAGIGPIVSAIGTLVGSKGIGGLMTTISKLVVSDSAMGAAIRSTMSAIQSVAGGLFSFIAANPILAIIAGIVAAIALLYTKCEWFRNGVNNIFNGLRNTVTNVWNNIRETILGVIDRIRNAFNFQWSFPPLKLPHVSISGAFSLTPPSVPHFSIQWYKNGAILNKPTIFGMSGNTLLGGGEAGQEAVLPIDKLKDYMQESNDQQLSQMASIMRKAIKDAMIELNPGVWLDRDRIGEIFEKKIREELFSA